MKIGFTGSRHGMTAPQLRSLRLACNPSGFSEFHIGDCVGADVQAAEMIRETKPGTRIIVHPPINDKRRAFFKGDLILEPKEYLARNKDIADSTDVVIGAPASGFPNKRSGSWWTIRYCFSNGRKVYVFLPDGSCIVNQDKWFGFGDQLFDTDED